MNNKMATSRYTCLFYNHNYTTESETTRGRKWTMVKGSIMQQPIRESYIIRWLTDHMTSWPLANVNNNISKTTTYLPYFFLGLLQQLYFKIWFCLWFIYNKVSNLFLRDPPDLGWFTYYNILHIYFIGESLWFNKLETWNIYILIDVKRETISISIK